MLCSVEVISAVVKLFALYYKEKEECIIKCVGKREEVYKQESDFARSNTEDGSKGNETFK